MKRAPFFLFGLALLVGCGSEEGGGLGATLKGLQDIPSIGSLLSIRDTPTRSRSVVGTPPLLKAGFANVGLVEPAFWNGVLATINSGPIPTSLDNAALFWGSTTDAGAGMGGCLVIRSVAQPFSDVLGDARVSCYLREMAETDTALLEQNATTRTIKLSGNFGYGATDAWVTVFGTDAVGLHTYRLRVGHCAAGVPVSRHTWEVNRLSGLFTLQSAGSDGVTTYEQQISGWLKTQGLGLTYNTSAKRSVLSRRAGSGVTNAASVEIQDGALTTKFASASAAHDDRLFGRASYTGENISALRITEGAYKGLSTDAVSLSTTYEGQFEYQSGLYKKTGSGSLLNAILSQNFATDAFFTSFAAPAPDLSDIDCAATTADQVVSFVSTDPEISVISNTCLDEAYYVPEMCYESDTNLAKTATWGAM